MIGRRSEIGDNNNQLLFFYGKFFSKQRQFIGFCCQLFLILEKNSEPSILLLFQESVMECSCYPCTLGATTTSSCPGPSSTFSPPSPQVFPGLAVITGGTLKVNIVKLTLGLVSLQTLSWSRPTIMYTEYSQPFVVKKTFDMKLLKLNNDILCS